MIRKLLWFCIFFFPAFSFAEKPSGISFKKEYFKIGTFKEVHDPKWGVEVDPWCINDHTFIYDQKENKWHVIGITHARKMDYISDPGLNLLHISADSLFQTPWKIHPHTLTADFNNYKESVLWAPHCIFHKGTYYMYVCAGSQEGAQVHESYQINLYTSKDLKSWKRYEGNPLFTDGFDARDPMIIKDKDQWIMYYTANSKPEGGNHIIASYTSKDLLHWENRLVVFTHPRTGTFGGPTESPFVVRRGDWYYMFLCDGGHLDVYRSQNPFSFKYEDMIAEISDCRASEIIRDANGKDYISSVGWFGGDYGLKIAPITWMDGLDGESTSLDKNYIFGK